MKSSCLWLLLICLMPAGLSAEEMTVGKLTCEYRVNPLGIDVAQPRLSWMIASDQRGARQGAYQVLAASSPAVLAKDQGDLWDSGRVASEQSIHVAYDGKPLASQQPCWWKVRVWAAGGSEARPSPWSESALWSMGLLAPGDWHGRWIGKDEVEHREPLRDTSWIWYPEPGPPPIGTRYFRRSFSIDPAASIKSARLAVAADNVARIFVNGHPVGRASSFKQASEFDVATRLHGGTNTLAIVVQNTGDAPNPAGLLTTLDIRFAGAAEMRLVTDDSWKTAREEIAGWEQTDFDDAKWSKAQVLGPVGIKPWGEVSGAENRRLPARWLRKEFAVDKAVRRAMVYMSGLGLSELYINGQKIGDHVLSPGLTEYPKRDFYVTHDVTAALARGQNAIGVVLGNGRFYAPRTQSPTLTRTFGYPKLLLQMHIEYEDGSSADVVSDGTWKLTAAGPILANNEYDGEEYDARLEMPGWAQAKFDDSTWQAAQCVEPPGGVVVAQMPPPIRVMETRKPIAVTEPKPGMFIFDMGQNMVGWCRIHVTAPAGAEIMLRHAETLAPDGTLYLDNIRGARVTDRYICKGAGAETWEPRFTYHGFRYVEVTGWPVKPDLSCLEGRIVHDDLETAGSFRCSNPLLNGIYQNIVWGVRGNYRSIPTDCPQRDERQGWLGDRSAESRGETYLFNNAPLYAKWEQDIADGQKETGSVADVAPAYWPFYHDSVTWPGSVILVPGALLDQYGDVAIVARAYPAMLKWMNFMSGFIVDDLMPKDNYGDWCVPPEDPTLIHSKDPARKTAGPLIGTAYFYHCCQLMQRYATLLGKQDDARHFEQLSQRLKAGFNRKFMAADGKQYDNGSQTSCILPLMFGMVPEGNRADIFSHLVEKISRESDNHVGTGLVGGQWLMRVLCDNGRADLAYTLAGQKTYPSWGYMLENGATTIWELWNGNTADPGMNSQNHVMLVGDLVIWYYENLAGIKSDPAAPGFKHIIMRPTPVGDLTSVQATHNSPYGLIASEWKLANGQFEWNVTIPPNTTATLYVPSADAATVKESGRPAQETPGLKLVSQQGDRSVFQAGAGQYHLISK